VEYKTLKDLAKEWNISERRIRQLIDAGRIEGATKMGKSWLVPKDAVKPRDTRVSVKVEEFVIDLPKSLEDIDKKLALLNSKRPLPPATLKSLKANELVEWTYNSNGIEGNTLTLKETKVVLEGITIGGKSVKEHLEAINHKEAILYLEKLVDSKTDLTERDIRNIHQLVIKEINAENAGRYRNENVIISGATHIPPYHLLVRDQMEQLIISLQSWVKKYHPLVVAALLHGEFIKIHPFVDGNGRTARLLMNFIAIKYGFPPLVIKKEQRFDYYDALDTANTTKNYTMFVNQIATIAEKALDFYLSVIG
jgi:excisionase family DNA binding protein